MSMISNLVKELREYGSQRKGEISSLTLIAAETIELLSEKARGQEWIPCSERSPESQGYYICTCKDGSICRRTTTIKWSNGWQLSGRRAFWTVAAWMPLPEPWKGADDE